MLKFLLVLIVIMVMSFSALASSACNGSVLIKKAENYHHILFCGQVTESSMNNLIRLLDKANKSNAKFIMLEINSEGGDIIPGFHFVKFMEYSRKPINCVVDGDASSVAFYILQVCRHRFMTKRSKLMMHEPYIVAPESGDRWHYLDYVRSLTAYSDAMTEFYASRLNVPVEYIRARIAKNEWWFSPQDALFFNAVDLVVDDVVSAIKVCD